MKRRNLYSAEARGRSKRPAHLWQIMKSTLLMAFTQKLPACYAALVLTLSDATASEFKALHDQSA